LPIADGPKLTLRSELRPADSTRLFSACGRLRSKLVWTLTNPENRPCGDAVDMLLTTSHGTCERNGAGWFAPLRSIVRNCSSRAVPKWSHCCHSSRSGATSAPAWLGSAHLRRGLCAEPPTRVVEGRKRPPNEAASFETIWSSGRMTQAGYRFCLRQGNWKWPAGAAPPLGHTGGPTISFRAVRPTEAALFELDSNPLLCAPYDAAMPGRVIHRDNQINVVRNAKRADHV
jgi:hypothetical protein